MQGITKENLQSYECWDMHGLKYAQHGSSKEEQGWKTSRIGVKLSILQYVSPSYCQPLKEWEEGMDNNEVG